MTKAVIIGKFMPLHKGHEHMINFALNFCSELTIIVDKIENEEIPVETRYNFLTEAFPQSHIHIKFMNKNMPQHPSECENFWKIWKTEIEKKLCHKIDYIIGAMDYIKDLAKHLNVDFVMIDKQRETYPISATEIRKDPYKNWHFISDYAKPFYTKKIAVIGSESTGKSTLCKKLAQHFNTIWVPEYARTVCEEQNGKLVFDDFFKIMNGQISLGKTLEKKAYKVIFHDTDLITSKIWAKKMFNKVPDYFNELLEKQLSKPFSLYLLTTSDTLWIKDNTRIYKDSKDREWFQNAFIEELNNYNLPYKIIKGNNFKEKTEFAIKQVKKIMEKNEY